MLDAAVPVTAVERVGIAEADGRVAARTLHASIDVPPFARAAMDGYAVIAADVAAATADAPALLRHCGDVFTGEVASRPIERGECMGIATGAPMPDGADAVVMVERTQRMGDRVAILAGVAPGQNVGRAGSDLTRGDAIVRTGDLLTPARVGAIAAAGLDEVDVFVRPSVALLSTGNEITQPGSPLPPGHVYDVNRFTLAAVVRQHGGIGVPLAAAGDTLEALIGALDAGAAHDVVVFSGGSSVGGRDLMMDALAARGRIDFHGIAVKPGKPTLFGRVGDAVVFGMPGNPTSCLSNAYMLLVPFLRRLARLPEWTPQTFTGPLARGLRSTADRHQFYPVRIAGDRVEPVFKSSGDITSLADADGFIEVPTGVAELAAGTTVVVTRF